MVAKIHNITGGEQIENSNKNRGASLDTKQTTLFYSTLVKLTSILGPLDPSAIVEDLKTKRKITEALKNSNTKIKKQLPPEQTGRDKIIGKIVPEEDGGGEEKKQAA